MKKGLIALALVLLMTLAVSWPASAQKPDDEIKNTREELKNLRQDLKDQIKKEQEKNMEEVKKLREEAERLRKEKKEESDKTRKNIFEQVKEQVTKALKFGARKAGELTGINGNVLTVKSGDKSYTVNVTDSTVLSRKYGGKSVLSEFSPGDRLNVIGKWVDDTKAAINASFIRNLSIQRRWGVFFGQVKTKNTDNFVITAKRGEQTVYYVDAKLTNRRGETIAYSDIQVGHRVRVKGVWDSQANKIIEVDEVKNFSLPTIPLSGTPSVTPTVTPTTTSTPTPTPTTTQ